MSHDLDRCQRGGPPELLFQPRSFAAEVRPHQPGMLATARRILGCSDLASDAVQETLILLWKRAETPPDLKGWLTRMTKLRALQMKRALGRRSRNEQASHDLDEPCCDPLHQLLHGEIREGLRRALAELPQAMREVVVLREFEGLDYAAIADAVRAPVGTVRSRLNRARRALSASIDEEGTPRGPAA